MLAFLIGFILPYPPFMDNRITAAFVSALVYVKPLLIHLFVPLSEIGNIQIDKHYLLNYLTSLLRERPCYTVQFFMQLASQRRRETSCTDNCTV